MMQNPKSGPHSNIAYAAPGWPWVTGSTPPTASIVHISFPTATTSLFIRNTSSSTTLSVAFTSNGLKSDVRKYFTLTGGQELDLKLRTKDLFVSATAGSPTVEIIAGLSYVLYSDFPTLTGTVSSSSGLENPPLFSGVG